MNYLKNCIEHFMDYFNIWYGDKFQIMDLTAKPKNFFINTDCSLYTEDNEKMPDTYLMNLLRGEYKLNMPRFKPKKGEKYSYVAFKIDDEDNIIESWVETDIWSNAAVDLIYYLTGNCFRNMEEAKEVQKDYIDTIMENYHMNERVLYK